MNTVVGDFDGDLPFWEIWSDERGLNFDVWLLPGVQHVPSWKIYSTLTNRLFTVIYWKLYFIINARQPLCHALTRRYPNWLAACFTKDISHTDAAHVAAETWGKKKLFHVFWAVVTYSSNQRLYKNRKHNDSAVRLTPSQVRCYMSHWFSKLKRIPSGLCNS